MLTNTDGGTPTRLFQAIDRTFGPLTVDLAATSLDTKCPEYISPEDDALAVSWVGRLAGRRGWLNPPFTTQYVETWAEKCLSEARLGAQLAVLLPIHLHHNWWWQMVRPYAGIYVLAPQLTADGRAADLAVCTYNIGVPGLHRFHWETGDFERLPSGGFRRIRHSGC